MDKPARLSWRIENAKAKGEADLYVYDVIGDPWGEGTNASDFVRELNALDVDRINLHINSPGGFVNDALAMYNALIGHRAWVDGYIEGSGDSAASFLFQAANRRFIAKNASMTIHEGHAYVMGPAITLRAVADELDAASENIASIYAERAGGTVQEWRDRMLANGGSMGTTYRGQAAVDIGLADEVGIHARNQMGRIAAQATPEPPEPTALVTELRTALDAARLVTAAPTLQQLLEQHQKEPLTAAFGKGA